MEMIDQLEPTIFIIFGGAGDLSWRKLIPALFDICQDRNMPSHFAIIAVDFAEQSDDKFRRHLHDGVNKFSRNGKVTNDTWNHFATHIHYFQGDFNKQKTYKGLSHLCLKLEEEWNVKANHIFYMAVPPSLFGIIPVHLKAAGLSHDPQRFRLVVEKPFGHDLQSARELHDILISNFTESQIFRIDHYLGKETVQNILALRFANPQFEPIWNRRYIEYVTITVAEKIGVGHRGGYYDHAGALRDMMQNHLMQLLCLVAMEPMVSLEADEIRNKKIDVLHAVRAISSDKIHKFAVRGQYCKGMIDGQEVKGYREEAGVAPDSQTATYMALKLLVDNWRWHDVPFYLRTGKRLTSQASEIVIHFRNVPHKSFPPEATLDWQPSRLILSIQPEEGIIWRFQAKYPGPQMHLRTVDMRFSYCDTFAIESPDAYETLLWDVMKNDLTLFMRADQIEAAWKLLTPVIDMWSVVPPIDFPNYEAGTWGPEAANGLLALDGHTWPLPTELTPNATKKAKKQKIEET